MIGSAPNCRAECVVSSDCPSNEACINQKCVDPCPGTCAPNAECRVVNHSPVCDCIKGFTGDGFSNCRPTPVDGKILYYSLAFVQNCFLLLLLIFITSTVSFRQRNFLSIFMPHIKTAYFFFFEWNESSVAFYLRLHLTDSKFYP